MIDLRPGDVVVSATDPDDPEKMKAITADPKKGTWDHEDLGRRLGPLAGRSMKLEVIRSGQAQPKTVVLSAEGFEFDDVIVETSAPPRPGQEYDPLRVVPLPIDPRVEGTPYRDPFVFRKRMRALAGKPVVIQVKRASDEVVNVLVPPAYHVRLGARMEIGEVAAVREGSEAKAVGVRGRLTSPNEKPDVITGVRMTDEKGTELLKVEDLQGGGPEAGITPLDPVRLPDQLASAAAGVPGKKYVHLSVKRIDPSSNQAKSGLLPRPLLWDETMNDSQETPQKDTSPLSIPQLGLAYWVESKVEAVEPGSPAARARKVVEKKGGWVKELAPLERDDVLLKIRAWDARGGGGWGPWAELYHDREDKKTVTNHWAQTFHELQSGRRVLQFIIKHKGDEVKEPYEVVLEEDQSWPLVERGLVLSSDTHIVKADTIWQALKFGLEQTRDDIMNIYQGLHRIIRGRVSTKTFGGPIEIVSTTFTLARENFYAFLLFMGVLSINLAVVNFLPIPLLDGGHMVFLIYEKIRGKPASERVREIAAYIGLSLLLALMVYVFVLDIQRRIL